LEGYGERGKTDTRTDTASKKYERKKKAGSHYRQQLTIGLLLMSKACGISTPRGYTRKLQKGGTGRSSNLVCASGIRWV